MIGTVQMTGRSDPTKFQILSRALVDGSVWYTVDCLPDVSAWIRQQPKELQHEHIDSNWVVYYNKYDIHEKLYTILALKWQ